MRGGGNVMAPRATAEAASSICGLKSCSGARKSLLLRYFTSAMKLFYFNVQVCSNVTNK